VRRVIKVALKRATKAGIPKKLVKCNPMSLDDLLESILLNEHLSRAVFGSGSRICAECDEDYMPGGVPVSRYCSCGPEKARPEKRWKYLAASLQASEDKMGFIESHGHFCFVCELDNPFP